MPLPSVQPLIANASAHSEVTLPAGDYGPLVIERPLNLDGGGATLWGDASQPALTVRVPAVSLKSITLRHLAPHANASNSTVVLAVETQTVPTCQQVCLHGATSGWPGESAPWLLPSLLHLGELTCSPAIFTLELGVPVPCRLASRVVGLDFDLPALIPGICFVQLRVRHVVRDSLIIGHIEVVSASLCRLIPVWGRVLTLDSARPAPPRSLIRFPDSQRHAYRISLAPHHSRLPSSGPDLPPRNSPSPGPVPT